MKKRITCGNLSEPKFHIPGAVRTLSSLQACIRSCLWLCEVVSISSSAGSLQQQPVLGHLHSEHLGKLFLSFNLDVKGQGESQCPTRDRAATLLLWPLPESFRMSLETGSLQVPTGRFTGYLARKVTEGWGWPFLTGHHWFLLNESGGKIAPCGSCEDWTWLVGFQSVFGNQGKRVRAACVQARTCPWDGWISPISKAVLPWRAEIAHIYRSFFPICGG